jgi:hypothetical protein
MKVYCVVDIDNSSVAGVFSSYELAKIFLNKLPYSKRDFYIDEQVIDQP